MKKSVDDWRRIKSTIQQRSVENINTTLRVYSKMVAARCSGASSISMAAPSPTYTAIHFVFSYGRLPFCFTLISSLFFFLIYKHNCKIHRTNNYFYYYYIRWLALNSFSRGARLGLKRRRFFCFKKRLVCEKGVLPASLFKLPERVTTDEREHHTEKPCGPGNSKKFSRDTAAVLNFIITLWHCN